MSWALAGTFRRNNFDALRIAFAVLVIFSHCYPITGGKLALDPIDAATGHQIDGGFIAVNGFFAISGFLIAHSWVASRSNRSYFAKRAKRILPGFLVAMAVTALVIAPLGSHPWRAPLERRELLRTAAATPLLRMYPTPAATFAHNPYPNNANGSMWTIKYEALGYVGLAIAGTAGLLGRRRPTLLLFLALIAIHTVGDSHVAIEDALAHTRFHRYLPKLFHGLSIWPRMATYFWAGTTFYTFRASIPQRWWLAAIAAVAIVAGVVAHVNVAVFPFAGTYLLFYVAYHPAIHLHNVARHGDFSYGTYLYAFAFQQLIVYWMPGTGPMELFAIAAPAAVAAGAVSWHAVERRFVWKAPVRPPVVDDVLALGPVPQPA